MKTSILSMILFVIATNSFSQRQNSPAMHMNLFVNFGGGFSDVNTGIVTEAGDDVKLSAGGGVGIGLQTGYTLRSGNLDFSVSVYSQSSSITPSISNGSGTFSRTLIEPAAKYLFALDELSNKSVNIGLGAEISIRGVVDFDASKIDDGAHNIFTYKTSTGPVVLAEYFVRKNKFGFTIGLKYYSLKYTLESLNSNGQSIPISNIPPDIMKDVDNVNGSGMDMYFGIGYYF